MTKQPDITKQPFVDDRLDTPVDYQEGLTQQQVADRLRAGQSNKVGKNQSKTYTAIIRENTLTFFNLIFLVLALLLAFVQSYKNLSFVPVVLINILIGVFQEVRAKKVLDNLNVLDTTTVSAVREGQEVQLEVDELVINDVVLFRAGTQIMADAVVLNGEIQVNEALLTGESDEITKRVGDKLLSGSFVVSGRCYGELEKVGEASYISKLTSQAKKIKNSEQSEMVISINRFIKWVGIIIVPVGLILFYQSYILNNVSLEQSITTMVAALIGMIPEGLYLLTTISLAMGAARLAKQKVLLHNMKSIETLARVDVLCVDKTGTITENKMTVAHFVPLAGQSKSESDLSQLVSDFAQTMAADNDTMVAIKEKFNQASDCQATSYTTFSSVEKFSSVTFGDDTFVLGAPEVLLKDQYDEYKQAITQYSEQGLRVLIFGQHNGVIKNRQLTSAVTPLALIVIANPVRENAKETFQYFAKQDVAIKVISGDNPLTVSYTAKQAGISGAENYVDARTLNSLESMDDALKKFTVFGRVTPEQKEQFVDILKDNGKTVAMTGDGVNDILAMKKADCSIAMASGNDATAKAAQVVLLESDFSKMPQVVLEGRQIVNNIERSASLFLVKNIFSLLMSVFAILLSVTYPLNPLQITLISLFTIGLPSFLLTLEKNNEKIKGHFMTNVFSKAAPGGITDMVVVGILVICGTLFKLSTADVSTAATLLLIVVGFFVLYKISTPMNAFRQKVFFSCLAGMIIVGFTFSKFFSLTRIDSVSLLLLVILFVVSKSIFQSLSQLIERFALYSQQFDRAKLSQPRYFVQTVANFFRKDSNK